MNTNTNSELIDLPSADALDTGGCRDGYRVQLYLIPADERDDGRPAVTTHTGIGNIGTPVRAWHGRWRCLGGYGSGVVGESVLDVLRRLEPLLVTESGRYLGTEWSGSNHVGRWADEESPADDAIAFAWQDAVSDLRTYWCADDWFAPANVTWVDLAGEAGVDPERALGDDWEEVAREVARIVEPLQDELVSGTDDYALHVAGEYRAEHAPITYSISAGDSADTRAWLGLCLSVVCQEQDAGRCRLTAITDRGAELEAALEADDGVIAYEVCS